MRNLFANMQLAQLWQNAGIAPLNQAASVTGALPLSLLQFQFSSGSASEVASQFAQPCGAPEAGAALKAHIGAIGLLNRVELGFRSRTSQEQGLLVMQRVSPTY